MSRVGKYPVPLPQGVQVTLQGRTLVAKGRLGELRLPLTEDVEVEIQDSGSGMSPEVLGRLFTPFFITVGLVEAAYFINLAFMALFVFATPGLQ